MEQGSSTKVIFQRSKRGQLAECFIIIVITIIAYLFAAGLIIHPRTVDVPNSPIYEAPNNTETISSVTLMLCITLPWYILFIFDLMLFYFFDSSFVFKQWFKHFFLMNRMIFFNFGITLILTGVIKCLVGSPRPYYRTAMTEFEQNVIDEDELNDAKLSFPSGHASLSMCMLFLLSFLMYQSNKYAQNIYYKQLKGVFMVNCDNPHSYYLLNVWYVLREIPLLSILILFIPTMVAIYISITRIIDYKHFAADVVGGMVIGIACALISYSVYSKEIYFAFDTVSKKKYDQIELESTSCETTEDKQMKADLEAQL